MKQLTKDKSPKYISSSCSSIPDKQPNQNMGRISKQTFLQSRHEVKWKLLSCGQLFATPHVLYNPWNSLGQNSGVGGLSLLQQIFPIQESNQGLLHCRRILYQLSHQGSQEDIKMLINTWKDAQHCSLLEKCKSKLQWGITSHWSEWPSSKSL